MAVAATMEKVHRDARRSARRLMGGGYGGGTSRRQGGSANQIVVRIGKSQDISVYGEEVSRSGRAGQARIGCEAMYGGSEQSGKAAVKAN
jgi:hypothetical protein